MRVLHPLLLFTLATSAAPAVVTEVVTEIAQATPEPIPAAQVPVQAPHDDEPAQKDPPVPPKPPPPPKEEKYFHEPGWDAESGHYDARYFRGKVPYEQHRPALRRLVRSYLTTFAALGVETWLAHGSLLGWWWNGRVMPWDYDT